MKISESYRRLLQALWVVVMVGVVVGSLLPGDAAPIRILGLLPVSDKLVHFSAYLALSFLPVVSFSNRRKGIIAALLMIVLGIALEGGQSFAPGRDVEFGDVIANMLGVLSGILAGLPLR